MKYARASDRLSLHRPPIIGQFKERFRLNSSNWGNGQAAATNLNTVAKGKLCRQGPTFL